MLLKSALFFCRVGFLTCMEWPNVKSQPVQNTWTSIPLYCTQSVRTEWFKKVSHSVLSDFIMSPPHRAIFIITDGSNTCEILSASILLFTRYCRRRSRCDGFLEWSLYGKCASERILKVNTSQSPPVAYFFMNHLVYITENMCCQAISHGDVNARVLI